jgi:hypothetical protein
MKIYLFYISLIILAACNTPYYTSINKMKGQPATLTLNNGTVLTGKLNVNASTNFINVTTIQFAEGDTKEYKDYFTSDIKSIFYNGNNYAVKLLITNALSSDIYRLVKLLNPPGSKIELYEYETTKQVTAANGATVSSQKVMQYYLQLPGATHNEVYNIESAKFTPNFDEKMSAIVQDCPTLAEKIKSKNKDYFYPYFSSEQKRKIVLQQIINEYNNCQ